MRSARVEFGTSCSVYAVEGYINAQKVSIEFSKTGNLSPDSYTGSFNGEVLTQGPYSFLTACEFSRLVKDRLNEMGTMPRDPAPLIRLSP